MFVLVRIKMVILGENLVEIMYCSVLIIVGVNWLVLWKFRVSWVDRKFWIIDFFCIGMFSKSFFGNWICFDIGKYKFGNRYIIFVMVIVKCKFDIYGCYGIF